MGVRVGGADPRRGRHQGQEPARRDRRAVVVAPVHRRARVLRDERPAAARPQLRPPRPGHRVLAGTRAGHRPGAGLASAAVPGVDLGAAAHRRPVAGGGVAAGQPGAVPRQAAGRRHATGDRAGLRGLRDAAVPRLGRGPADGLQLPGLGRPVQAPGRRLLRACRGVRRRSVRDARLARQGARRAARRVARQDRPWRGFPGRGHPPRRRGGQPGARHARRRDRGTARRVTGGLLVSRDEPGAAARPAGQPGDTAGPAAADRRPAPAAGPRHRPARVARPRLRSAGGARRPGP